MFAYPYENSKRTATAVILKGGNVIDGIETVRMTQKGVVTVTHTDDGVSYETVFHASAIAAWEYAVKAGA